MVTRQETAFSSWLYRAADDLERVHFTVPIGVLVTPRYRIEAKIGSGGFGTVHEATDLVLSRRVALKLIHASHLGGTKDLNPYLRTFLREARVTSQLIHPNIVTVHDLGRVEDCREAPVLDGAPFMVTELVEGTSLRERLGKPMELTACLDIVLAICDALIHAHGHGVLHRDLKPENVMCTRDGIKVLDFGIAESFERTDRLLRPSTVEVLPQEEVLVGAGTPGYMAPEQVAGGHQDQRTDLFGLGVLMYELFAGQRPSVVPKPLRSFRPDVPAGLAELVHSCIALPPDDRPTSAARVRELLQRHRRILQPDETRPTDTDAAAICPFPGLAAFDDSMVPYFFGRERESIECLDLVDATPRWLWIEARSGQGKSSFVRAGLLSLLRARWPLRSDMMTERWLSRSELEFEGFVVEDDGPAIFVIDQLEELGLGDEEARRRASSSIQRILEQRHSPTLLITTIRSDLVPELLGVLDITSALNRHGRRYTLPKLKDDALRQAVEGPSTLAGLHLEPGLSDTILSDCGAGQSTLPLVADILRTLYEKRDGRTLRLADYYALGRVGGSVARWAEALVAAVPNEEMLRALLISLICIRDGRPTSRPLTVQAAIEAAGGGTAGRALLMSCLRSNADEGAHRLLTAESLHDQARVELVHEALITSWPRLRGWVSEHTEAIAARDEVESSAKAWNAAGRLDDGLTRGDQLAYFRSATDASELARAFLKRSAEREQEDAVRILRRRRVVQVVGVVALAVFAGTVGWTLNERRQAEALRSKSVEIAQRATTLISGQEVTGTLARRTKIHDEVAQVLETSAEQGVPPTIFDRIRIAQHRIRDHHQGDDFEAVLHIVDRTLEAIQAQLQATPDDREVLKRAAWFTYRAFWSVLEAAGSEKAVEIVGRGIRWSDHYMKLEPDDAVVHSQRARLWVVVSNHDAFRLIGSDAGNMLVNAGTEIIDRARLEECWPEGCNGRLLLGYSIRAHGHEINGAFGEAVADFCVVAEFERVHLDTNDTQEAKRLLAVTDRRIAQLAARNGDHLTAHTHAHRSLFLTFDVAAENQSEQRWYRIHPAVALWVAGLTDALAGHISNSRRFLGRALSWSRRHSAGNRGQSDLILDIRTVVTLAELAYRDRDELATVILTDAVVDQWSHYRELGWFNEEMEVEVVLSLARSERLAGRLDLGEALIDAYVPVAASRAEAAGVFRVSLRHARLLVEQAALKCASGALNEGRTARDVALALLDNLIGSRADLIVEQARRDAYAACL